MATVTVRLHGAFSDMAGGVRRVTVDARTVGEALDRVPLECPGLRERIRNEQGHIRDHLNVFHNEEEIGRREDGETAELRDGDVVHLVPAMSGGEGNGQEGRGPGGDQEGRVHLPVGSGAIALER